jgi:nitrate reductase delta subunit
MSPLAGLTHLSVRRAKREADRAARARATALVYKAAAVCLSYPGEDFPARLALVRGAASELPERHAPAALALRRFVAYAASQDPYDLAAAYVATFDQRNRTSLYLTWWTAGDTRNRGMHLVRFLEAYRAAGCNYGGEELPDHLPVLLDFTACGGERAAELGTGLLTEHRHCLEKLRDAVARCGRRGPEPALADYAASLAEILGCVLAEVPKSTAPDPAAGPTVPAPLLAFGDLAAAATAGAPAPFTIAAPGTIAAPAAATAHSAATLTSHPPTGER